MSHVKEKLLNDLAESVVDMEEDDAVQVANDFIESGYDAYEGISNGLAVGMDEAGKLYEEEEYYIPELLMCSDAMYAGMDVLKPYLKYDETEEKYKAVVGVVEGDTHDIGKNLFKIMLETTGFEVYDLGRDVPPSEFINKAKELGAKLIGLSTLMTTTMDNMEIVINLLKEEGIRDDVVVMVGGGPISQSFADKIGADGYAPEASRAARLAKDLVRGKMNVAV
ncbi:cobalamin-binding protein [Anaerosalibacter bizertensis]|uniref:Cobalamin-binding protein n=1 Tax=Anaerosalibacter bizertensis TaxID=932217 RepID=A0A844FGP6_9FIRM|nr:corrinoid protein [Anaerosalibacter bizertensis]MBV1816448.1 corrinoid protein [Bacteroidales bacterium MSK.15.36]HHV26136.1 cobalamin-binding protein [Tissierellia bacterium]MBU5292527.1 corrinoid protein [Anaerosalibacter bizertensis]MCB5559825.1 corrinoid protein [Anaerosalibacter bizertensis]MCG4563837.1 corrinoid protein [Anaerosalibacter bizertensis]